VTNSVVKINLNAVLGVETMSKVALVQCSEPHEAADAVTRLLQLLGEQAVANKIPVGGKVLIKPNICVAKRPSTGATTHPEIVEAIVRWVLDHGAQPIIGEGPAVGAVGDFFGITGLRSIAEKYNIPLINLNTDMPIAVSVPSPLVLHEVVVAKTAVDCDVIINLPVMKTHLITMYTGALKNMKGLMVALEKHKPHKLGVPEGVVDVNKIAKPVLHIMDGIVAMEGDGPAGGSPVGMGVLIAAFDPVALDAAALYLMNIPLESVRTVTLAEQAGLGTSDFTWIGDPPERFRKTFRRPCTSAFLKMSGSENFLRAGSRWVLNVLEPFSKVRIQPARCIGCGACAAMCPYQAIYQYERGYRIDERTCKKCLCCHEVCRDNAIYTTGILGRRSKS
jgi:uncharacterized protein (DUF362 family)/Pyruvate/2-oxoacid:ferredoxin oxidoreductase delta subunit